MPLAKQFLCFVSLHPETIRIVRESELQLVGMLGCLASTYGLVRWLRAPSRMVLGLLWEMSCKEGKFGKVEGTGREEGTSESPTGWSASLGRRSKWGIQKSEALSALAAPQQKHSLAGKCQPAREAGAAA